jgi:hypothetical protein
MAADLALACTANVARGLPIFKEDLAILSAFSSKPKYEIRCGSEYNIPGKFVQGPFIVLDNAWDVAARSREGRDHTAQSVTLRLPGDEGSDDDDEDTRSDVTTWRSTQENEEDEDEIAEFLLREPGELGGEEDRERDENETEGENYEEQMTKMKKKTGSGELELVGGTERRSCAGGVYVDSLTLSQSHTVL